MLGILEELKDCLLSHPGVLNLLIVQAVNWLLSDIGQENVDGFQKRCAPWRLALITQRHTFAPVTLSSY